MPRFTVIVPALNEEANLDATVATILEAFDAQGFSLEVLVFDDASTDRTGAIADDWARRDGRVCAFHNRRRLNIGGIYKAGIGEARGDHLLLIPGDGEVLLDQVLRGAPHAASADMVLFYVTNAREIRSPLRVLLSGLYVRLVNLLFNTRFRYTNGTNIFRTDILRQMSIVTDGFSYQTEAVVKALRSGASFVDVGVRIKARKGGRSTALSLRNIGLVVGSLVRLWFEVMVQDRRRYARPGRRLGTY
jgi:glycosyltransferase involved in cell wall biosynthesis